MRYLVDDATKVDPRAKLTTSVIATLTGLQASEKQYIIPSGDAGLIVLKDTVICVGNAIFKVENNITLNTSNLDEGAFAVGKDYYIYVCDPGNLKNEEYKISLNATFPVGYNADNSRKIGGFHFGDCRRFDSYTMEPINSAGTPWGTGWEDNIYEGILPFSVWTLLHRPACSPEGMVYVAPRQKWIDIYLTSINYLSEYGAYPLTGSEGIKYYDWYEKISRITGKRLLSHVDFICAADGSPNGRDDTNEYAWTKTTNIGRNFCGIIKKAVSVFGLKDCVGNVWEVSTDISWTSTAFGATTTPVTQWDWRNATEVGKGAHHQTCDNDMKVALNGGDWSVGAICGSRAFSGFSCLWSVNGIVGGRLSSESM